VSVVLVVVNVVRCLTVFLYCSTVQGSWLNEAGLRCRDKVGVYGNHRTVRVERGLLEVT
jgi:hypothetical protein